MWHKNQLTDLIGIRYPIIQGPFGGGLSTVRLVAEVSNAGGLGSYGAHVLSPDEIITTATEIRNSTNGPFVMNLWVSDHDEGGLDISQTAFEKGMSLFRPFFEELEIEVPKAPEKITERYEEQVQAILDARPPVFSFVFGIPSETILRECQKRDILTLGAATTVSEAVALENAGVDIVLASGFEAGGHRVSFLKPAEESLVGTLALVPQVVDSVKIPVIAAGGISDGRGIAATLALGAHAAQIGTAFLACDESGTSKEHREILLDQKNHNTVLSRAYTGRLARFISNKFIRQLEMSNKKILPFPMQSWFTSHLKKMTSNNNKDYSSFYASQAASLISHKKAVELFGSLVHEVNQIIYNQLIN